jgi:hypothetical protein
MSQNTLSKAPEIDPEEDEVQTLKSSYEATQMMLCELNVQFLTLREENQKLKNILEETRTTVDAQQQRRRSQEKFVFSYDPIIRV